MRQQEYNGEQNQRQPALVKLLVYQRDGAQSNSHTAVQTEVGALKGENVVLRKLETLFSE